MLETDLELEEGKSAEKQRQGEVWDREKGCCIAPPIRFLSRISVGFDLVEDMQRSSGGNERNGSPREYLGKITARRRKSGL